ncbi:MAG: hypothetical protein EG824_11475 [Deltaproteobacteria bacterium]|nr:hypothetical protein [Deltaproteobacteria bacterium]
MKRHVLRSMPVTTMLAIVLITMGMGRKPPAKPAAGPAQQRGAGTTLSRKAALAAMEGQTRKREDVRFMGSAEQDIYRAHVEQMRDINPESHVIMQYVEDRVVKVGLDSSYAVVVESKSYIVTEEGRDPSGCLGGYFIEGSLYALDTLQRVLWRKEYESGEKPMSAKTLEMIAYGDIHFVVEIPDSTNDDEYNRTNVLFDRNGKELRRFITYDYQYLSEGGKYLIVRGDYDRMSFILHNLVEKDSLVVYGGGIEINEANNMVTIGNVVKGKAPKTYLYKQVKGKIIDLR